MNTQNVLVISLDEAKDILCEFWTDVIMNDRSNTKDHVRAGNMCRICPNINELSPKEIAEQFGDMNLGEKYVIEHDQVVVQTGQYEYEVVWDRRNLDHFACPHFNWDHHFDEAKDKVIAQEAL